MFVIFILLISHSLRVLNAQAQVHCKGQQALSLLNYPLSTDIICRLFVS